MQSILHKLSKHLKDLNFCEFYFAKLVLFPWFPPVVILHEHMETYMFSSISINLAKLMYMKHFSTFLFDTRDFAIAQIHISIISWLIFHKNKIYACFIWQLHKLRLGFKVSTKQVYEKGGSRRHPIFVNIRLVCFLKGRLIVNIVRRHMERSEPNMQFM